MIVFCNLLTACVSTDPTPWIGKTEQAIIMELGPPSTTSSDGAGGKVLAYTESATIGGANAAASVPISQSRLFYVNPDGLVYAYKVVDR